VRTIFTYVVPVDANYSRAKKNLNPTVAGLRSFRR
jgi:hypothetical protein